ncbi:MAG TPA: TIGR03617 family F420-dependent LLM class oxidoreductase [Bacillota bacterium]
MKIEIRLPTRAPVANLQDAGSTSRLHSVASRLQLQEVPALARELEAAGFDGLVSNEMKDDPFLPLALAAQATERVTLTTAVAIAFPRSPMATAQAAWALQQLSRGRFVLGLGTQVKAHNERRYSTPWTAPGPRLREYVQALRAIWNTWQTGAPLDFRGRFYTFTLMPPAFNAGPIEHPHIPVHIAAVNLYNCRTAGEVGDGLRPHSVATPRYIREVMLPAVHEGARRAGRSPEAIEVCVAPLVATAEDEAGLEGQVEAVRRRLAFYASTRSYRPMFDIHGWGHIVDALHPLSVQGRWSEMPRWISDEMVETMAIVATYDRLANKLKERFGGLAARVLVDLPDYDTGDRSRLNEVAMALRRH